MHARVDRRRAFACTSARVHDRGGRALLPRGVTPDPEARGVALPDVNARRAGDDPFASS